ncbi:Hypothetical protein A7982_01400 [Minicystis rosea]|nr:Hypothetical protein A7982_01400 [Minicystis rosea]
MASRLELIFPSFRRARRVETCGVAPARLEHLGRARGRALPPTGWPMNPSIPRAQTMPRGVRLVARAPK